MPGSQWRCALGGHTEAQTREASEEERQRSLDVTLFTAVWRLSQAKWLSILHDLSSARRTNPFAAIPTWNACVYGIGNCHLLGVPSVGR